MRSAMVFCVASLFALAVCGQTTRDVPPLIVVERLMSAAEFRTAGLEKLSAPELVALNAWLTAYVSQLTKTANLPSSPGALSGKWLALDSNTIRIVRDQGKFVYAEAFSRDEQRSLGNYDLARQSDGTASGHAKLLWLCRFWCRDVSCNSPMWVENSCTTESEVVLTSLGSSRIEGYVIAPKTPDPLDRAYASFCRTCGAKFPRVKQPFVWVRLE